MIDILMQQVWDLSSDRPSQIHTLTHSESVSSIKWRPKRRTQITACSIITGLDPHLYVWDLMRPYVPYASFDSQTNKVQSMRCVFSSPFLHLGKAILTCRSLSDFVWRNSPNFIIASTTKQNFAGNYHINLFNIADATRPAGHSTPVTVQLDRSSLAFAIEEDTDPKVNTLVTKKSRVVHVCSFMLVSTTRANMRVNIILSIQLPHPSRRICHR